MLIEEILKRLLGGIEIILTLNEYNQLKRYCIEIEITLPDLLTISKALFHTNRSYYSSFLQFLYEKILPSQNYQNQVYNQYKIKVYNNLAFASLQRMLYEPEQDCQNMLLAAKKYLWRAQTVTSVHFETLLLRAYFHIFQGKPEKAIDWAKKIEEEYRNHLKKRNQYSRTQLLLAQIHHMKKSYEKALQYYKKYLGSHKSMSIKIYLGFADCFYHLAKYQMARFCYKNIISRSLHCSQALIGLASIEMKDQNPRSYFEKLNWAYEANKNNPLVLYHIAYHFLVKGVLEKCQLACNTGLKILKNYSKASQNIYQVRCNFNELYLRFLSMLGQIAHKTQNFDLAISYYEKVNHKQIVWNGIYLAQCLTAKKKFQDALLILEKIHSDFEKQKKDIRVLKDTYKLMGYLKYKCRRKVQAKDAFYYYNQAIKYDKNDPQLKQHLCYILTDTNKHHATRILQDLQKLYNENLTFVKPEMYINMGVLAIEGHQPQLGQAKLRKAIQLLQNDNQLDLVQLRGFTIIAKYNLAISLQNQLYNYRAISVYEQIIKENKFHISSYIRMSYVYQKLGNYEDAYKILNKGQVILVENNVYLNLVDNLRIMKCYILFLQNKFQQALQILFKLFQKQPGNMYYRVLQFSIKYAQILQKENNLHEMHEILQVGKSFTYNACSQDPQSLFCYMMLAFITIQKKQLPKDCFASAMKEVIVNSTDIPTLRFNMGLYYYKNGEQDAAITSFHQYREISRSTEAQEIIAYLYLINKEYKKSIKTTQKMIMLNPSEMKHRAQLIYAVQARTQDDFMTQNLNVFKTRYNELKRCVKFHEQINLLATPNKKKKNPKFRVQFTLLKALSQEKLLSSKQTLQNYQKRKKEIEQKERMQLQARQQGDNTDSEDQQAKMKRIQKEKRERALAKAKASSQQITQAWKKMNDKTKEVQQKKPKRKNQKNEQPDDANSNKQKATTQTKQKAEQTGKAESEDYYPIKKQRLSKSNNSKMEQQPTDGDNRNILKYLL